LVIQAALVMQGRLLLFKTRDDCSVFVLRRKLYLPCA